MNLRAFALALAVASAVAGCATSAGPGPSSASARSVDVKSLLWVGNSFFYYNNSMHGHVGQLLNSSGAKGMRATSATISGSGINWHDVEA